MKKKIIGILVVLMALSVITVPEATQAAKARRLKRPEVLTVANSTNRKGRVWVNSERTRAYQNKYTTRLRFRKVWGAHKYYIYRGTKQRNGRYRYKKIKTIYNKNYKYRNISFYDKHASKGRLQKYKVKAVPKKSSNYRASRQSRPSKAVRLKKKYNRITYKPKLTLNEAYRFSNKKYGDTLTDRRVSITIKNYNPNIIYKAYSRDIKTPNAKLAEINDSHKYDNRRNLNNIKKRTFKINVSRFRNSRVTIRPYKVKLSNGKTVKLKSQDAPKQKVDIKRNERFVRLTGKRQVGAGEKFNLKVHFPSDVKFEEDPYYLSDIISNQVLERDEIHNLPVRGDVPTLDLRYDKRYLDIVESENIKTYNIFKYRSFITIKGFWKGSVFVEFLPSKDGSNYQKIRLFFTNPNRDLDKREGNFYKPQTVNLKFLAVKDSDNKTYIKATNFEEELTGWRYYKISHVLDGIGIKINEKSTTLIDSESSTYPEEETEEETPNIDPDTGSDEESGGTSSGEDESFEEEETPDDGSNEETTESEDNSKIFKDSELENMDSGYYYVSDFDNLNDEKKEIIDESIRQANEIWQTDENTEFTKNNPIGENNVIGLVLNGRGDSQIKTYLMLEKPREFETPRADYYNPKTKKFEKKIYKYNLVGIKGVKYAGYEYKPGVEVDFDLIGNLNKESLMYIGGERTRYTIYHTLDRNINKKLREEFGENYFIENGKTIEPLKKFRDLQSNKVQKNYKSLTYDECEYLMKAEDIIFKEVMNFAEDRHASHYNSVVNCWKEEGYIPDKNKRDPIRWAVTRNHNIGGSPEDGFAQNPNYILSDLKIESIEKEFDKLLKDDSELKKKLLQELKNVKGRFGEHCDTSAFITSELLTNYNIWNSPINSTDPPSHTFNIARAGGRWYDVDLDFYSNTYIRTAPPNERDPNKHSYRETARHGGLSSTNYNAISYTGSNKYTKCVITDDKGEVTRRLSGPALNFNVNHDSDSAEYMGTIDSKPIFFSNGDYDMNVLSDVTFHVIEEPNKQPIIEKIEKIESPEEDKKVVIRFTDFNRNSGRKAYIIFRYQKSVGRYNIDERFIVPVEKFTNQQ